MRMTVPMATVEMMVNEIDPKGPQLNDVKNPVAWYNIEGVKVAKVASPPIVKAIMNPVNVRYLALGPTVKLG
jgi:hypothetical protein